jgi:hypothetical protein
MEELTKNQQLFQTTETVGISSLLRRIISGPSVMSGEKAARVLVRDYVWQRITTPDQEISRIEDGWAT